MPQKGETNFSIDFTKCHICMYIVHCTSNQVTNKDAVMCMSVSIFIKIIHNSLNYLLRFILVRQFLLFLFHPN